MNSKKAKAIRKSLRLSGVDVTDAIYEETNVHTVSAVISSKFVDGILGEELAHTTAHTAVLVDGCGRQCYKAAKAAA